MKNRNHPLRLWVAKRGMTLQEFAAAHDLGYTGLGAAICGRRKVTPQYVARLSKITRGAVTTKDFLMGASR